MNLDEIKSLINSLSYDFETIWYLQDYGRDKETVPIVNVICDRIHSFEKRANEGPYDLQGVFDHDFWADPVSPSITRGDLQVKIKELSNKWSDINPKELENIDYNRFVLVLHSWVIRNVNLLRKRVRTEGQKKLRTALLFLTSAVLAIGVLSFFAFTLLSKYRERVLFDNSDFARGDLSNWIVEGNAFLNQPTYGDNSLYRGRGTADLRGKYWIGGAEDHHTKDQPWGKTQSDGLKGKLTSIPFIIERNKIGFMIGAGNSTHDESVALMVDGKEVLVQDGRGNTIDSETMSHVVWDVSRWKGKKARVVILDNYSGGWGHINTADFRYF